MYMSSTLLPPNNFSPLMRGLWGVTTGSNVVMLRKMKNTGSTIPITLSPSQNIKLLNTKIMLFKDIINQTSTDLN